jgi:hypothetical protein
MAGSRSARKLSAELTARRTRNAQSSSVHRGAGAPPPLGAVPRIGKFELGDQSPNLNLVTVRQPPGPLGCGRVVWAVKVDHAPQLAVLVQNECTIVWHHKFPHANGSYLRPHSAAWRFWVITSYLLWRCACCSGPLRTRTCGQTLGARSNISGTLSHDGENAGPLTDFRKARCHGSGRRSAIANANGPHTFVATIGSTKAGQHSRRSCPVAWFS